MKILCVIDSLNSGGAQRQLVTLAKGFKKKGHDVSFLTYHELNFFKPQLDAAQISVNTIVEQNYIKRLLKMRKIIRQEKPDAVIAFLQSASFIATFAGFPFKKWTLVIGERNGNPNMKNSRKIKFLKFFHIFGDFVVANSHKTIGIIKKTNSFLSKSKLKVIYNIVRIPEQNISVANVNEHLNVVIVARYSALKNLDGLIVAVNLLPEDYKRKIIINWYGRKAGNQAVIKVNERKIRDYDLIDVIKLNDVTADVSNVYQAADFVALLSHYEGFPNTICEAMALKRPVIVSKVSDIPFLLKEGENGFLCDSDNVYSIRDAFVRAIDSTSLIRKNMGENNYSIAKEEFNKEIIVDKYLELLKNDKREN